MPGQGARRGERLRRRALSLQGVHRGLAVLLHKWLGIGALVFALTHWLWTQGPKWMVQLGALLALEIAVGVFAAAVSLAGRICAAVPQWRKASLWFYGPVGFGEALQRDFAAQGFDLRRRFHREFFEFR